MNASLRKLALPLCLGFLPILAGCMFDLAGGSTSTETGDKVSLTGRVIGGGGEPIAGARVTLMRAGLFDITNAQGYYELIGTSEAEPATEHRPDTLNVEVYGQHVLKRSVTDWVGGLSGVQVSPRSLNVAVRCAQHSPRFGQRASSQTVCRPSSETVRRVSTKPWPPGTRTLSQGG
jgi:hypothetical protein